MKLRRSAVSPADLAPATTAHVRCLGCAMDVLLDEPATRVPPCPRCGDMTVPVNGCRCRTCLAEEVN